MNETQVLEQNRGKESYRVEIEENEIRYESKGTRGDGSARVPFELLSRRTTPYTRSNPFFRNASIYFGILTVLTAGFGFLIDVTSAIAILWAALAAACYLAFRLTGVEYEVFPLADGRAFRLLRDRPDRERYRAFKESVYRERDEYLLTRYARINVERPARAERRRIDWLRDEGVISEDAYITIVETIEEQTAHN
ncbi:MAG: hypothetical protein ACOC1U_06930 [Spirochaetota bacterium]